MLLRGAVTVCHARHRTPRYSGFRSSIYSLVSALSISPTVRSAGGPQPSTESLKKVVDGKVALMDGEQERSLPGGEAEGKFCVSLSKLLHLDEVGQGDGSGGGNDEAGQ